MKWLTNKRCRWCGIRLYWWQALLTKYCELCNYALLEEMRPPCLPDTRRHER